MKQLDRIKIVLSIALVGSALTSTPLNAGVQAQAVHSYFDSSWTTIASDEEGPTPGSGGQGFDAEYLLYKTEGTILHLGLQSGFDLIDGHQIYNSKSYWAGDLALSFDGIVNTGPADPGAMADSYEFGIDFGLYTADYDSAKANAQGDTDGIDAAGVYRVPTGDWNTNLVDSFEDNSSPFAMDQQSDTSLLTALSSNVSGSNGTSFYRAVSFDLTQLGLLDLSNLTMDVHWTMSCGNDFINAREQISVPEPGALLLMATGLLGLVGSRKLRRKKA